MAEVSSALIHSGRADAGDFASALRSFRLAARLSQEELAERAGTGVNTISALERGARRAPYRSTVDALAAALGLSDAQRDALRRTAVRRRTPVGLAAVAPVGATHTPRLPPTNFPHQLTPFVGREREIAEIMVLIDEHRLVTLCGSGGVGKTRTSLEAATDLIAEFPDGAWLIELGPLAEGNYVPSTIAQTLHISIGSEGGPLAAIVRALATKRALLLFDTCEHLIDAASEAIRAVLAGAPAIRILATSRQSLSIAGEATYRIPPLAMPDGRRDVPIAAAQAANYDAVALFVDRATRANDRFRLSDDNAPFVMQICDRLDGIPLAIELAASRSRSLSPRQIHERLDERFRLLAGGSRDVVPRQQTLRALIDWSYELLDERERQLLDRTAVFVKGFPLEGAVAVGRSADTDEHDVLDILDSLVEKSLVSIEPSGETFRYSLLDSTRAYAWEKLDESGDLVEIVARHRRYLRDRFAQTAAFASRTGRQTEHHAMFVAELENVRAALDRALRDEHVRDGAALLAEISSSAWESAGLAAEGIARLQAFHTSLDDDVPALRARLAAALAPLLVNAFRQTQAHDIATAGLASARQSGDPETIVAALNVYSWTSLLVNRLEDAEAALAEAERNPDVSAQLRLFILARRAQFASRCGDLDRAVRSFERLREVHASLGNVSDVQTTALNLAEVEHARGQTPRAVALLHEILPNLRRSRDKGFLVTALCNLAGYLIALDDLTAAAEAAREGLEIFAALEPDNVLIAILIEHLALVYALRGEPARAATLCGFVDAAYARHGFAREFVELATHARTVKALADQLQPLEHQRMRADGAVLGAEAAVAVALAPAASGA